MHIVSSYVYALEGRLRIKIPEIKGAAPEARAIEGHLALCPGVEEATANPVTGSVLIMYNPRLIGQEEILLVLNDMGYLLGHASGTRSNAENPDQPHQEGVMARVANAVTSSLMERALSSLVAAII
jgi:hypothetical protein